MLGELSLAKKKKAVAKTSKKSVRRSRKAVKRSSSKNVLKRSKRTVRKTKKTIIKKTTPAKSSKKFNLLVSFNPNHASTAESELAHVLQKIGENPKIAQTGVEGLFKTAVSDARKVVSRLRNLCQADPNLFAATHHYTPIDVWCKSDVSSIQKQIKLAALGIEESDKWKLELNKRHWKKMEGGQLIIKLTDVIERENVDLDNPQKIVQVEIIDEETGVALLTPDDVFDVEEVKDAT